jgi:hypothetical protein
MKVKKGTTQTVCAGKRRQLKRFTAQDVSILKEARPDNIVTSVKSALRL